MLCIKGSSVDLNLPAERSIAWLVEAALLWAQETKGLIFKAGKCEARRTGGEVLPPSAKIGSVLRENETVTVLLP